MNDARGAAGARVVAVGLTAVAAAAAGVAVALEGGLQPLSAWVAAGVAGALIVLRLPRHPLGWFLVLIGLLAATGGAAEVVAFRAARDAGDIPVWAVAAAWYAEWYWLPFLYLWGVGVPVLLPDGRPPSPAWRWLPGAALVAATVATTAAMLQQDLLQDRLTPPLDNPLGLAPWADVDTSTPVLVAVLATLFCLALAAVASLVVRYRVARGIERKQLTVVTVAVALTLALFVTLGLLDSLGGARPVVIELLLPMLVPAAILVAVTRYRLFDIDRLLSRTAAYTLVSAVLAGLYVVIAVVPSTLFEGGSDLLVAAATLAVAAAFRPVRAWAQGVVDRRFSRSRYDAARTVAAFAQRLRAEVDVDVLSEELVGVVSAVVRPVSASLWLPPGPRRG